MREVFHPRRGPACETFVVDPRNRLTDRWSFIWFAAALANGVLWSFLGVWPMLSLSLVCLVRAGYALSRERRERLTAESAASANLAS